MSKITNEFLEKEIVRLYRKGEIAKDILKNLGFPPSTTNKVVYRVLRENGVERRKNYNTIRNTINHNIFEKIDLPSKAYFLGLLIADGCIAKPSVNREMTVRLELTDKEILEHFRLFLGSRNEVLTLKKRDAVLTHYLVVVSSNKMVSDLATYGVIRNKTHKSFLPILKEHLMSHLIRGIFDGDGSVGVNQGYPKISICGNYDFISQIRDYLITQIGIRKSSIVKAHSIFQISWGSRKDVSTLATYMYKDANELRIDRKFFNLEYFICK
jgi:hypothetical protein